MIRPQDIGNKPFFELWREFPSPGRECLPGDGNSFLLSAQTYPRRGGNRVVATILLFGQTSQLFYYFAETRKRFYYLGGSRIWKYW